MMEARAEGERRKIRALVVDDEPFARERVRRLLSGEPDVEVVGESKDGFEAVTSVRELNPDLLFLDVQMPGKDGFSVLDELAPEETPVVIFLTAYDQYAVRAFEAAALDYLLKPFDEDRFAKAIKRARTQLAQIAQLRNGSGATSTAPDEAQAAAAADALGVRAGHLERLIIRDKGRVLFRRTNEVDWIEAYGNYVRLHFNKSAYLLRETIGSLEARLDPERFARIHRSTLVNRERISEMRPALHGGYKVTLQDGTRLTMSRRYRRRLPESLTAR